MEIALEKIPDLIELRTQINKIGKTMKSQFESINNHDKKMTEIIQYMRKELRVKMKKE